MASSYDQSPSAFDIAQVPGTNVINSKIFKPLDEALRCHICFDYFTNCMITKCSHNYCSVCIRRYMNYKSQCPTCFQEASEPELQNNRLIDEILRIYKSIRLQIPNHDTTSKSFPEQSTSSKSDTDKYSVKDIKAEISAPVEQKQENEGSTSDEVSCPVCYGLVPNSRINIHLDSCLKQTEERNQRKFLPKLVYHLLSDKDIKKKLKEHGLSTSGSRQALIRRHKNFVTLFNANCDSLNPKPVSDLIVEIEKQELEERVNSLERNTQLNRKSDPALIEKEHESYEQEHKSQFNALIQNIQQRILGAEHIKKEFTTEGTSNITDETGNVIGESSLHVGNPVNLGEVHIKQEIDDSEEPVIVKEEPLDSKPLLQNVYISQDDDTVLSKSAIAHKELDTGMEHMDTDEMKTPKLPFRVKKEVPSVKIKEEPQFLLDSPTDRDLAVDNSPLDDFQTGKTPIHKFHKKKYARRLSTEDKNSQRKK